MSPVAPAQAQENNDTQEINFDRCSIDTGSSCLRRFWMYFNKVSNKWEMGNRRKIGINKF
jgi:hypothetical protein